MLFVSLVAIIPREELAPYLHTLIVERERKNLWFLAERGYIFIRLAKIKQGKVMLSEAIFFEDMKDVKDISPEEAGISVSELKARILKTTDFLRASELIEFDKIGALRRLLVDLSIPLLAIIGVLLALNLGLAYSALVIAVIVAVFIVLNSTFPLAPQIWLTLCITYLLFKR